MATYSLFKETALPGSLVANAIYLIAPAANPGFLEIYVTDSAGSAQRRIPTIADIQTLIDTSVAGANSTVIVDDIAARDALAPNNGVTAVVLDASADPNVTSGAATYIYRASNTSWIKISEAESMDLTLAWSSIVGRPSSAVADIDDAVSKRHTHANKTQLDLIGEDGDQNLTYRGSNIAPRLSSAGW
jgi:hypothetical protein